MRQKTFDGTNHNLLFAELLKRNLPKGIIRVLMSWYRDQTTQVKWGNSFSFPFTATNGVGQGGF